MSYRMLAILRLLAENEKGMTPNEIGYALGFDPIPGGKGQGGRGKGHRMFGPAQRVIFPLTRLRELGLVGFGERVDGLAGTAYYITDAGEEALQ